MARSPLSLSVGRRARFRWGLAALSLWDNGLVPTSLAATPPVCVTPPARVPVLAALRWSSANRLCFCWDKNTKGFALSFPKPEIDTPVWRAVPAGPRQGIDSGFPSPSHPRRKAGRMSHVECGFAGEGVGMMDDVLLQYRACGAETRDDYSREIANENGLRFECVKRLADRLGEREDFRLLRHICEERAGGLQ
jgi:hypothetical protein